MTNEQIDNKLLALEERRKELILESEQLKKSQDELWIKIESYQGEALEIRKKIKNNNSDLEDIETEKLLLEI